MRKDFDIVCPQKFLIYFLVFSKVVLESQCFRFRFLMCLYVLRYPEHDLTYFWKLSVYLQYLCLCVTQILWLALSLRTNAQNFLKLNIQLQLDRNYCSLNFCVCCSSDGCLFFRNICDSQVSASIEQIYTKFNMQIAYREKLD